MVLNARMRNADIVGKDVAARWRELGGLRSWLMPHCNVPCQRYRRSLTHAPSLETSEKGAREEIATHNPLSITSGNDFADGDVDDAFRSAAATPAVQRESAHALLDATPTAWQFRMLSMYVDANTRPSSVMIVMVEKLLLLMLAVTVACKVGVFGVDDRGRAVGLWFLTFFVSGCGIFMELRASRYLGSESWRNLGGASIYALVGLGNTVNLIAYFEGKAESSGTLTLVAASLLFVVTVALLIALAINFFRSLDEGAYQEGVKIQIQKAISAATAVSEAAAAAESTANEEMPSTDADASASVDVEDLDLPHGWRRVGTDADNWYENAITGEMSYERPVGLPDGWRRVGPDAEGDVWYENSLTGESSWELPKQHAHGAPHPPAVMVPLPPLPDGWSEHSNGDDIWFCNDITGETTRTRPRVPATAPMNPPAVVAEAANITHTASDSRKSGLTARMLENKKKAESALAAVSQKTRASSFLRYLRSGPMSEVDAALMLQRAWRKRVYSRVAAFSDRRKAYERR